MMIYAMNYYLKFMSNHFLSLLFFLRSTVFRQSCENANWYSQFEDWSKEKREWAEGKANQVLIQIKRNGSKRLSTELYTWNLNSNCDKEDEEEERVVEEVGKYIDFRWFEFSGVDLVEDLH